jgi:ribosomal protein S18 acetylase RimI-like enzyme
MIKITKVEPELEGLRNIILKIDKKCYKRDIRFTEETLNNYLTKQSRIYLIISHKVKDTIIGYMLLYNYKRESYLASLAIISSYQGQGIGKKLFKKFLDCMGSGTYGKYTKLSLHAVNKHMIHMAEQNGFRKVRITKEYYGKENAILMEKRTMCKVEGCGKKMLAKQYCKKHYAQYKTYGYILKITYRDPNEMIIKKDHALIVLRDKDYKIIGKAIIDLEDVERVKKYKWCLSKSKGYVKVLTHIHKIGGLARYVLKAKPGTIVDHKDRNTLNNRKDNLRFVDSSLNKFNTDITRRNNSGIIGVHWRTRGNWGRWVAEINKNNKTIFLGYFKNKEDAKAARKKAELKYFGENIIRRIK